jgi:hypothetical protein
MDFATELRAAFPDSQETVEELSLVVLREYQRRNGFEEWCAVARWTAALSAKEDTEEAMQQWCDLCTAIGALRIALVLYAGVSRWRVFARARMRRDISRVTRDLYRQLFAVVQRDDRYLLEWESRRPREQS